MSGKTSLMLGMVDKILNENQKELVFWREPIANPIQFDKLEHDYQVLTEKTYPLEVYEIQDGEPLIKTNHLKIRKFRGVRELISMAKPGMLNVVYLKELFKWVDLIEILKQDGGWQSIFLDEGEDVFPLRAKEKQWYANERFSNTAKEIRKARINLCYNTQSPLDIDWRIRTKIMVWFFLRGSRGDKYSPVYTGAIHNLEEGQGYVDLAHTKFGLVRFKPYYPRVKEYIVLPKNRNSPEIPPSLKITCLLYTSPSPRDRS